MTETSYAKGITAEDLRTLLGFWPLFFAEGKSTLQDIQADKDKFLSDDAAPFAWCHLYELPIKEHSMLVLGGITQNLGDFISQEQVVEWFAQLVNSPSQVGELPNLHASIGEYFDALGQNKDQTDELRPTLANTFGNGWSMLNTLRCVLYHGCYLNELIERARNGDDAALFAAVRMDATVVGCPSVVQRISKAAILEDKDFFTGLKNAINGKHTKREQANFQMMRLVLEVLHEAGATRLNDAQLHQLFVDELNLYSSNAKNGGCAKTLRKFVDTYMKKNATT